MFLSDLQNKNIVNIENGTNIGNIIDINIDNENGKINSFLVEQSRKGFSFSKNNSIEVDWNKIKKIGEDVILVSLK